MPAGEYQACLAVPRCRCCLAPAQGINSGAEEGLLNQWPHLVSGCAESCDSDASEAARGDGMVGRGLTPMLWTACSELAPVLWTACSPEFGASSRVASGIPTVPLGGMPTTPTSCCWAFPAANARLGCSLWYATFAGPVLAAACRLRLRQMYQTVPALASARTPPTMGATITTMLGLLLPEEGVPVGGGGDDCAPYVTARVWAGGGG